MADESFFSTLVALLPEAKREAAWRIFARLGERDEDSFLVQMLLLMEMHIRWFEITKSLGNSSGSGAPQGTPLPGWPGTSAEDFHRVLAERRSWEDTVVRDIRRLREQVSRAWIGMCGAGLVGVVIGFFLGSCAR